MEKKVYIALGSNLDDPAANLGRAAADLAAISVTEMLASSIWVSSPEGFAERVPDFCNAVVAISVDLQALPLLNELQVIERKFGRLKTNVDFYESRRLDLDIIDYDGTCMDSPGLTLPHPRAFERQFVLQPLLEIAPEFRFPGKTETLEALIARAPSNPMRRTTRLIPSV